MKAASSKKASLRRWIWRAGVSISLLSLILAEGVPITTCFIRTFQVERQHQNAMQGVRASAEQKARSIHHYREFGYPIIASLALFSIAFFAFMGCGARSAISGTSRRWSCWLIVLTGFNSKCWAILRPCTVKTYRLPLSAGG